MTTDRTKHVELNRVSLALLKACGLSDHRSVHAVTYRHEVGEIPTLQVEYYAMPDWETFTLNGMELRTANITFVPLGLETAR